MKFAKVLNGVVDSISLADETDPVWILCPDNVFAGYSYIGGRFVVPPRQGLTLSQKDAAAVVSAEADMQTPLVQTILKNPPNETMFRATLEAHHRAKI